MNAIIILINQGAFHRAIILNILLIKRPTAILTLDGLGTFIRYNDKRRPTTEDRSENTVPERVNINRSAVERPFKLYDTNNNEINENNFERKWSCPDFGPEK